MMPRSPTPKATLILAGGRSSRMGQDKAQLPVQGVPLLRRVYDIALAISPTVAVITPWPEQYQSLVPTSCRFIREPFPTNETQSPGPLVGLMRGLEGLQELSATYKEHNTIPWIMLLACDLPRLNAETLATGAAQLAELPPDIVALVPQSKAGWEPLCAFYQEKCLTSLQSFVQAGGRSFQEWLETIPVHPWNLGDRSILFNCNTLEDWQTAEEQ